MQGDQNNRHSMSLADLQELIHRHSSYTAHIQPGIIQGLCRDICIDYSLALRRPPVEHVMLDTDSHMCLAIRTSDSGTVIFDPTFRQFFPTYPSEYFLGSPHSLHTFLEAYGMEKPLAENYPEHDPLNGRTAYTSARIEAPLCTTDTPAKTVKSYMAQWKHELGPLAPHSHTAALGRNSAASLSL